MKNLFIALAVMISAQAMAADIQISMTPVVRISIRDKNGDMPKAGYQATILVMCMGGIHGDVLNLKRTVQVQGLEYPDAFFYVNFPGYDFQDKESFVDATTGTKDWWFNTRIEGSTCHAQVFANGVEVSAIDFQLGKPIFRN